MASSNPHHTFVIIIVALSCIFAPPTAALSPPEQLVVENIPSPSDSLVEEVSRYTEFRSASLGSWHPVKREMLINTRFAETQQVHRVCFPGGARTQLTFYKETVHGGSYQPVDGRYFIFARDSGGDENYQKYRFDTDTGKVTLLTDGVSRNTGGAWSLQGDLYAYESNRRNKKDMDIYVLDPSCPKESERLVAEMEGGGWHVLDWSPDRKSLLVSEYVSITKSHLWLMDVATGARRRLAPKDENQEVSYLGGCFSADGKGVYTTTDRDSEFHRLAFLNLETGNHVYLTDHIPWDVDEIALSWDGANLAFVTNEDGISRLHVIETATRAERKIDQVPSGFLHDLSWHKNNKDLAFVMSTARYPSDVYSIDLTDSSLTRWTESETGGINTAEFREAEAVHWKSFDGHEISGLLYRPPAKFSGKRPVLIAIHGGPESQSTVGFLGRLNFYLNELGIAIIFPNVRGSTGYGKTFCKLDNGLLRENSYKDIDALLDWIAGEPHLDSRRVMVAGGSYGGHMTLAVLAFYGNRIACAQDVVGPSNLVTFLERTESYRRDLRRAEYGDERDPDIREHLLRIAPRNHADKMQKPLFVVQGKNDPRVPLLESEDMVRAVRSNGTPVWYLMAKDEGHGFRKKSNADFLFYSTIMFMKEYLLKSGDKQQS